MEQARNKEISPPEEKIRDISELFRLIVENSRDGIVSVNREGRFLFANKSAARNLGYSKEEFLKLNITDIEVIESKDDYEKHYADMLNGERLRFETKHRRKDGSLMDVEIQLSTFEMNGETVGYAIWRDITETKRLKDLLMEQRDVFQNYLNVAGVMLVVIGEDQRIQMINKKACELLECKEEDIIGRNWFDSFIPERFRDEIKHVFNEIMLGNIAPFEYYENPIITKIGKERIIAWHNTFLKDKSGKIYATLSSGEDITERKRLEETLKNEHNKLISILNSMQDGVCIVNQEYNIEYINPVLEKEFGNPAGRKCYEYFHGRNDVCPYCPNFEVWNGKTLRLELFFLKNQKTYDLIASPLKNPDGSISKLGVFHDVTERKKAEEALRESEERYRALFETAPEGIYTTSTEGIITSLNPAFEDITGWKRDEWLGRHFKDLTHPDDLPIAMKWFQQALKGEKTPLFELRVRSKSGEYLIGEFKAAPLFKNGKIVGLSGIARNITDRKKLEDTLKNEHNRLINVLNSMQDGVCIFSSDYEIEYINPLIFNEFGTVEGRKCYEYFHDRKEVCPWCPNKEVWEGKTVRWEWYSFKNQKTYDLIDTPLRKPDGRVVKLQIFRDITERKKMEEERARLNKELSEKIESLEKFHRITVGREIEMVRLKAEVNELLEKLGQPKKYEAPDKVKSSS